MGYTAFNRKLLKLLSRFGTCVNLLSIRLPWRLWIWRICRIRRLCLRVCCKLLWSPYFRWYTGCDKRFPIFCSRVHILADKWSRQIRVFGQRTTNHTTWTTTWSSRCQSAQWPSSKRKRPMACITPSGAQTSKRNRSSSKSKWSSCWEVSGF